MRWCGRPWRHERDVDVAADQGEVDRILCDDRRADLARRCGNQNILHERALREARVVCCLPPDATVNPRG
jgi:hypothetical protein